MNLSSSYQAQMEVKNILSAKDHFGIDFGSHYVKLAKCSKDQASSIIIENKLSKKKSLYSLNVMYF